MIESNTFSSSSESYQLFHVFSLSLKFFLSHKLRLGEKERRKIGRNQIQPGNDEVMTTEIQTDDD